MGVFNEPSSHKKYLRVSDIVEVMGGFSKAFYRSSNINYLFDQMKKKYLPRLVFMVTIFFVLFQLSSRAFTSVMLINHSNSVYVLFIFMLRL